MQNFFLRTIQYVLASFAITGCAPIVGAIHESIEQPLVKPSPNDVLRITVISGMDVDIRLQANYYTTNRECDVQKWPGNPAIGHSKAEAFSVPASQVDKSIDILLDKYQPGRCLWKFGGVSVGVGPRSGTDQSWSGLLSLSDNGKLPDKPIRVVCRNSAIIRSMSCSSSIHYLRSDVRAVTIETASDWDRKSP